MRKIDELTTAANDIKNKLDSVLEENRKVREEPAMLKGKRLQ